MRKIEKVRPPQKVLSFRERLRISALEAKRNLKITGAMSVERSVLWAAVTPDFKAPGAPTGAQKWFRAERIFYEIVRASPSLNSFIHD